MLHWSVIRLPTTAPGFIQGRAKEVFPGTLSPFTSVCFRLSESDFVLPDSHTERPISLCLKVKNIDQKAMHWTLIDLFSFAYEGHRDKLHTI